MIGPGQPDIVGQAYVEPDILVQRPPQHILHAGDQTADIDRRHVERLAARESEQALGQRRGALGGGHGGVDIARDAVGAPGRQMALQQVERPDHAGQHIVEVMRDAAGQLAHRLHLLRLTQRLLGGEQLARTLLDPLFQAGVEFGERRGGADTLDMRPGPFGDRGDQPQFGRGPVMRLMIVDGHQRGQAAALDQRHADGRGDADVLEGLGLMRRQIARIVVDDERQARMQPLQRHRAEIPQAVVTDDGGRTGRRPVAPDGKAVLILIHVGIGAVGQAKMRRHHAGGDRHHGVRVIGVSDFAAEIVQEAQPHLIGGQRLLLLALQRHVGVDADPFAQASVGVEHRHGADEEAPPLPVRAAQAMFEYEHVTLRHGFVPGIDRGLGIVGVDGVCPAIALIFLLALTGERGPAGLVAAHFPVRAVGPEITVDRRDGRLEPLIAGGERQFALPPFGEVQHRADHPGRLAGRIANDEAAVEHRRIAAVGAGETIFVGPVDGFAVDRLMNAVSDAVAVVGMDVADPPVARRADVGGAVAVGPLDRFVPEDMVGREIPVPDRVVGCATGQAIAFLDAAERGLGLGALADLRAQGVRAPVGQRDDLAQLQLGHDLPRQHLQHAALLVRHAGGARRIVQDAERADRHAAGCPQQRAGVEAQAIVRGHQRIVDEARVLPRVRHDHEIILQQRLRADRHVERHFAHAKAHLRLEPLPVAGDEVDDRDGRVERLRRKQRDIIEIGLRRRVEDGVAFQRRDAFCLAPDRREGGWSARGVDGHGAPLSAQGKKQHRNCLNLAQYCQEGPSSSFRATAMDRLRHPAGYWARTGGVHADRDLSSGGTWLGAQ